MKPILTPLFVLVFSLAVAACGCLDNPVDRIPSPDGKLVAELRQCGCRIDGRRGTNIHIYYTGNSGTCEDASRAIGGFGAPLDYAPMKIKWIANNTLQASYPDYPGFPRSYWLGSEGEAVKFHFPGRAEFYANENAATANDQ